MSYRYASSMGEGYCLPRYFLTLEAVNEWLHDHAKAIKLIADLPGQDSMRIEGLIDGEWVPV